MNTLGKLLVFLVNYTHYTTFFYYEKASEWGTLGGSECTMNISIISYGKNHLNLQPA